MGNTSGCLLKDDVRRALRSGARILWSVRAGADVSVFDKLPAEICVVWRGSAGPTRVRTYEMSGEQREYFAIELARLNVLEGRSAAAWSTRSFGGGCAWQSGCG
jgi:hypothetical protein